MKPLNNLEAFWMGGKRVVLSSDISAQISYPHDRLLNDIYASMAKVEKENKKKDDYFIKYDNEPTYALTYAGCMEVASLMSAWYKSGLVILACKALKDKKKMREIIEYDVKTAPKEEKDVSSTDVEIPIEVIEPEEMPEKIEVQSDEICQILGNQVVTTSLVMAQKLKKRHKDILRAIRNILEKTDNRNVERAFKESDYEKNAQKYPMYYINRDGFSLLIMSFNSSMEWKIKFLEAFNDLEAKNANKDLSLETQAIIKLERSVKEHDEKISRIIRALTISAGTDYGLVVDGLIDQIAKTQGKEYKDVQKETIAILETEMKLNMTARANNATKREGREVSEFEVVMNNHRLRVSYVRILQCLAVGEKTVDKEAEV